MTDDPQHVAHSGLIIDASLFGSLLSELARRGEGRRESGAFLLARGPSPTGPGLDPRLVEAVAYYDDLDPTCLTGGITFAASGYTTLSDLCRRDNLYVVGDVHSHPSRWVSQSDTDANHPMVAMPGHVALIVPCFAQGNIVPHDLGVHIFAGSGRWTSSFGPDAATLVRVTTPVVASPPAAAMGQSHFQRALRWVRQHLRFRGTR